MEGVRVDKVLVARKARGPVIERIEGAARSRGVEVQRVAPDEVVRLSRNAKQDQGVVADVEAPRMDSLGRALEQGRLDGDATVLVLDGLTNPANVGLILRTATAAGVDGVVIPRRGCPEVGPLVVKASAGVAFRAPILRVPNVPTALDLLEAAGFALGGLEMEGAADLFTAELPARCAFVLGNETAGVSEDTRRRTRVRVSIPMAKGVESLNAAVAAALLCYERLRRSRGGV